MMHARIALCAGLLTALFWTGCTSRPLIRPGDGVKSLGPDRHVRLWFPVVVEVRGLPGANGDYQLPRSHSTFRALLEQLDPAALRSAGPRARILAQPGAPGAAALPVDLSAVLLYPQLGDGIEIRRGDIVEFTVPPGTPPAAGTAPPVEP